MRQDHEGVRDPGVPGMHGKGRKWFGVVIGGKRVVVVEVCGDEVRVTEEMAMEEKADFATL